MGRQRGRRGSRFAGESHDSREWEAERLALDAVPRLARPPNMGVSSRESADSHPHGWPAFPSWWRTACEAGGYPLPAETDVFALKERLDDLLRALQRRGHDLPMFSRIVARLPRSWGSVKERLVAADAAKITDTPDVETIINNVDLCIDWTEKGERRRSPASAESNARWRERNGR